MVSVNWPLLGLSLLSLVLIFGALEDIYRFIAWRGMDSELFVEAAKNYAYSLPVYHFTLPGTKLNLADGTTADFSRIVVSRSPYGVPSVVTYHAVVPKFVSITRTLATLTWAICAPVQFSNSLRKAYPVLHHQSGYLLVTSVFATVFSDLSYYFFTGNKGMLFQNEDKYHIASDLALVVGSSFFFLATVLTAVYYARQRRFGTHRRWVLRHFGIGYGYAVIRLISYGASVLSKFGPALSPELKAVWDRRGLFGTKTDADFFKWFWLVGLGFGIGFAEYKLVTELDDQINAVKKLQKAQAELEQKKKLEARRAELLAKKEE